MSTLTLTNMEIHSRIPQTNGSNLVRMGDFWVRSDNIEQDLVVVKDIFEQDAYRTCLLSNNAGPQEVVVDIGAHIGTFARLWHRKNPQARIICVEACPENLEVLRANVGDFAQVVHAACTYETAELMLLNAVRPGCESTGGSVVVPKSEREFSPLRQEGYVYWDDFRELPRVTLEELMSRFGLEQINILKLDCEGSEYSILGNTPSLDRIRIIVGEFHVRARWDEFRRRRLAGWDYGRMLDCGERGGLFHYANSVWPPRAISDRNGGDVKAAIAPAVPATSGTAKGPIYLQPAPGENEYLSLLAGRLHADDRGHWEAWRPYYQVLYRIAHSLQARRVIEFGVRCGYSTLAFFSAVPGAKVVGYDAALEQPSASYLSHAENLVTGHDFRLIRADTQGLDRISPCDLIFLDGDHSYLGCLRDLELAYWSAAAILVDDYGPLPEVRDAVATFLSRHPDVFESQQIDFTFGAGQGPGACLLLTRKVQHVAPRPLLKPPLLHVAVPAGIGDSVWALTKIPHLLRIYGAERAHIALCGSAPYRALSFVERFDFVASAENTCWECIEANRTTPEGMYNWASSGIGWHGEYDWMLQANRHLESGLRLETWLPELETDWNIADRFRFTSCEVREAKDFEQQHGPYCVFYLGPETGNTAWGHNRGPLWTPQEWGALGKHFRELGLKIVIVGAPYDCSYFEKHAGQHLGECVNAIGHWSIGQTFSIVQRARCVVAYQSGIGIFAVYLGVPTACFWRPYGDSIEQSDFVSFKEEMASAWAPQDALASGRYLPLIYTKCTPESIVRHAVAHDWHRA
ncbi:MAG: FkbM family methyltransferase [Planctomycetia bacterium]|nr:FkbM family methyltransferase [Planctomycetia bacterium]